MFYAFYIIFKRIIFIFSTKKVYFQDISSILNRKKHCIRQYRDAMRQIRRTVMEKRNENEVTITTYDKVMTSWHRCMQSAKEFECYFHEIRDNDRAKKLFEEYAETEAMQASALRDVLLEYQK